MATQLAQILKPRFPHLWLLKYSLVAICLVCGLTMWIHQKDVTTRDVLKTPKYQLEYTNEDQSKNGLNLFNHTNNFNHNITLLQYRSKRIQDICQRTRDMQKVQESLKDKRLLKDLILDHFLVNRRYKIMYCNIPKIGSSFWKRLMKVIDSSNTKQLHLYDMTSMSAHANIPNSMRLNNLTSDQITTAFEQYTAFMFVRDPFSRLFSAYVDKILVPTSVGFSLLSYFQIVKLTDSKKQQCNHNMSFADFCAILSDALSQGKRIDPHFLPMSLQCDPCVVNFTLIGKLEMFMSDTRDILRVANISFTDVTGDVVDITTANELANMNDVIVRVISYAKKTNITCLQNKDVADRLWRHLQIRGFLSKTIPIPLYLLQNDSSTVYQETYIAAAFQAYYKSGTSEERLRQKNEAMMEAYASVPNEILDKLSRIFAEDCLLFDYSCEIEQFKNSNISQFYFRNL